MLRAIIFDCDGVLADTEPLHFRAMVEVLRPRGIELGWDRYERDLLGMTDPDMFRVVLTESGRPVDDAAVDECVRAKAAIFPAILAKHVKPMPGAVSLIRRIAKQWPLAICSGAYRADIETIVRKLGVADCFHLIVSCEDVQHGKPDPEGYRLALRRLNEALRHHNPIQPGECVVIEDSQPGVVAARNAGMHVIRFLSKAHWDDACAGGPKPDLLACTADALTDDMFEAACSPHTSAFAIRQVKWSKTPDRGTSAVTEIAGIAIAIAVIEVYQLLGMRGFLPLLTAVFFMALWWRRHNRIGRTDAARFAGASLEETSSPEMQIALTGNTCELAPLVCIADVPFEPRFFRRTISECWSRTYGPAASASSATRLMLGGFALIVFVIVLDEIGGRWALGRYAGVIWMPVLTLGAAIPAILFPRHYRVSPGRLDRLQYAPWRTKPVAFESVDLRNAKISVLYDECLLRIEPPSGEPWLIRLNTVDSPHAFAEAVVQAAISTATPPPLPEDELLG